MSSSLFDELKTTVREPTVDQLDRLFTLLDEGPDSCLRFETLVFDHVLFRKSRAYRRPFSSSGFSTTAAAILDYDIVQVKVREPFQRSGAGVSTIYKHDRCCRAPWSRCFPRMLHHGG